MAMNQDVLDAMDNAAKIAEEDLKSLSKEEEIKIAANWWKRHYMAAGHKRLAKTLLKFAD